MRTKSQFPLLVWNVPWRRIVYINIIWIAEAKLNLEMRGAIWKFSNSLPALQIDTVELKSLSWDSASEILKKLRGKQVPPGQKGGAGSGQTTANPMPRPWSEVPVVILKPRTMSPHNRREKKGCGSCVAGPTFLLRRWGYWGPRRIQTLCIPRSVTDREVLSQKMTSFSQCQPVPLQSP